MRVQAAAWSLLLSPAIADAHSFGISYNLPIPFWLYAYGTCAALIVSFLVLAWLHPAERAADACVERVEKSPRCVQVLGYARVLMGIRALGVALLALAIATGLWGVQNAYLNFSMTWFWILFLLGGTYAASVLGDFRGAFNPWHVIGQWAGKARLRIAGAPIRYPEWIGCWPALGFFTLLVCIELFGHFGPRALALTLSVYTVITAAGAACFGATAWLRHCEVFSVLFELLAHASPVDWKHERVQLRLPFKGLLEVQAGSYGTVLLILLLLSSTAFDGLHASLVWFDLIWTRPLAFLQSHYPPSEWPSYTTLSALFNGVGMLVLLLSPLLYFGIYWLTVEAMRRLGGGTWTRRDLALRFAFTLVPIAVVYNVTHYFTLLITQGSQLPRLLLDPFGFGWAWFGYRPPMTPPPIPNMAFVWHAQVALILLGHIVSVYLSHVVALRTFARRKVVVSQLPMLALMVLLTGFGLWILALPIRSGM